MPRPPISRLGVLCLALLAGFGPPRASGQTAADKPRAPSPPVQIEDIPQTPTPRDYSSWNISEDARTVIANALKSGDYNLAENVLAKLVEQNPRSPRLLTFLAQIFLRDNKPLNCAIALKKAEKLEPLGESDQFTLALCYVALKRSDWAAQEFEKLARANPTNALYPYWQGRVAYDNSAFDAAIEKFNKALELDPELARAYDNLGLCYEGMSNNGLALKNYERAIDLNRKKSPASPWPPLNYGMLLLKQGALDQAEPLLRESVSFGPKLPQAHHQLGILLAKQAKFTDAIDELKKVDELDPTYPESHFTLAHVYTQLGEQENAEKELNTFQKLKEAKKNSSNMDGSGPTGEKHP